MGQFSRIQDTSESKMYLLFIVALLVFVVIWFRSKYDYWRNKNVKSPKTFLIFGNVFNLFRKRELSDVFKEIYEDTKDEPFVGIYMFHKPALFVKDLDLAKSILVKDFSHFTDHGFRFHKNSQPLMINRLFVTNGDKWRYLRNHLTPAFTGSKIKLMFESMSNCARVMTEHIRLDAENGSIIDIKDIMSRFNIDVIASCAFGIQSNSFKDPNADFRIMGEKALNLSFKGKMLFYLSLIAPEFLSIFNGNIIDECVSDFFIRAVDDSLRYREENHIIRNDLMQMLIRLKSTEYDLNFIELASIAFGFFTGGLETSSTTLSCLFYELAKNPDIQTNLRMNIEEILIKHDGKITCKAINDMSCVVQVIEETLRLYPPASTIFRICTKDYVIPNTDIRIEKDTPVFIPTLAIQKDEKYYPDPDMFNPENFSPENKSSRHPFSFLSFGEGPRMCIGYKFALMQITTAVVYILSNYEITMSKNESMEIHQHSMLMLPKDIMVKITNRIK